MTSFEAGFIKYATEHGLSEIQAVHAFKRASAHPDVEKHNREESEKENSYTPADFDTLAQMLRHELIDSHYTNIKKRIAL